MARLNWRRRKYSVRERTLHRSHTPYDEPAITGSCASHALTAKRRQGRRNLYVDGVFVAGISDETLCVWDSGPATRLTPHSSMLSKRLRRPTRQNDLPSNSFVSRPHRKGSRDNLLKKEIPEAEINAVIRDSNHLDFSTTVNLRACMSGTSLRCALPGDGCEAEALLLGIRRVGC